MKNIIIAIDGPAGAGKSTIAKKLAEKTGFEYIDTGSMYRAATLKLINSNIDLKDIDAVMAIISNTSITFENKSIIMDGKSVDDLIRTPAVNQYVSFVSAIKELRQYLVTIQRKISENKNVILDGRDIGTVVFPNANFKFYLDASIEERANRRYNEVKDLNESSYDEIKNSISNRDIIDSGRAFSPLRAADNAIYIDTTKMSIDQVILNMMSYLKF